MEPGVEQKKRLLAHPALDDYLTSGGSGDSELQGQLGKQLQVLDNPYTTKIAWGSVFGDKKKA